MIFQIHLNNLKVKIPNMLDSPWFSLAKYSIGFRRVWKLK